MLYAVSKVKGTAANRIRPMVKDGIPQWKTLKEMIDWMHRNFGDPDYENTAMRYISQERMRNQEFSVYIAGVLEHQVDSGFDDRTMKFNVKNNISDELKEDLMPVRDEPEDFTEFVELLQKLDNKRRITNASKTGFGLGYGRGRGLGRGLGERGRGGPPAYLLKQPISLELLRLPYPSIPAYLPPIQPTLCLPPTCQQSRQP